MARKFKSATRDIQALAGTVEGKLGEMGMIKTENFPDGLQYLELTPDGEESKFYWVNGGLRGALTMANAQPGQYLRITHLGKVEFGDDGRTVNKYNIEVAVD